MKIVSKDHSHNSYSAFSLIHARVSQSFWWLSNDSKGKNCCSHSPAGEVTLGRFNCWKSGFLTPVLLYIKNHFYLSSQKFYDLKNSSVSPFQIIEEFSLKLENHIGCFSICAGGEKYWHRADVGKFLSCWGGFWFWWQDRRRERNANFL